MVKCLPNYMLMFITPFQKDVKGECRWQDDAPNEIVCSLFYLVGGGGGFLFLFILFWIAFSNSL